MNDKQAGEEKLGENVLHRLVSSAASRYLTVPGVVVVRLYRGEATVVSRVYRLAYMAAPGIRSRAMHRVAWSSATRLFNKEPQANFYVVVRYSTASDMAASQPTSVRTSHVHNPTNQPNQRTDIARTQPNQPTQPAYGHRTYKSST
jgi:hypothetical protein